MFFCFRKEKFWHKTDLRKYFFNTLVYEEVWGE
jgi:hypothetical protein